MALRMTDWLAGCCRGRNKGRGGKTRKARSSRCCTQHLYVVAPSPFLLAPRHGKPRPTTVHLDPVDHSSQNVPSSANYCVLCSSTAVQARPPPRQVLTADATEQVRRPSVIWI